MKLNVLSVALALAVGGCATGQYGSFVRSDAVSASVTQDLVGKLQEEFPAAKTVFFLNRSKSDTFGTQLDQALREKGFATTAQQGENEKSLNYVLDQVDSDIYRVMIYIDGTPYSRAYRQTENGAVVPTGSWTKRGD